MNNILIVTDYIAPYGGNFMSSIYELEKEVNKKGADMFFLFKDISREIPWVKRLIKTRYNKVFFYDDSSINKIKTINKIVKENNIHIIHEHFLLPKTYVCVKAYCLLNRNVKLISHYHNHFKINGNFLKRMLLKFCEKGDLNIACSESVAKSIPYDKKIVHTATNAIYFPRLDKHEDISFKKDNKIIITMLGFDYERKGVDIAIRALENIAKKYNILLLVVVSVKKERVEQKIINDFGCIPEYVRIMPPREDISSYYNISDIFLCSSREEGYCYAVLEASYSSCVCITSNITGVALDIPGIVKFESENYKDLEAKIIHVIKLKKAEIDNIKEVSREYVKTNYDISSWVNNIIACYNNL